MAHRTTIYRELTRRNPQVKNMVMFGPNTGNNDYENVVSWTIWKEFNADNLYRMFHNVVDADWTMQSGLHFPLTAWDAEFHDEDELEHNILTKHIVPQVNAALAFAAEHAKQPFRLNLCRSGRTSFTSEADRSYKPDWAVCRDDTTEVTGQMIPKYTSLMPGDTKPSSKWHSNFYTSSPPQWENPVRQVVTYCIGARSRYGFILTDEELVVLRIRTEPTGAGLAAGRSRRAQQTVLPARTAPLSPAPARGHARQESAATDVSGLSESIQGMSVADSSGTYKSTEAIDDYPVEYRAIPWGNHAGGGHGDPGKGKGRDAPVLTVRLALFYLCWMAAVGPNTPQESYPSLDSYWWNPYAVAFISNSTGFQHKNGVPSKLQYYNPQARNRGPVYVNAILDDATEAAEEQPILTLASVLTFDTVRQSDGSLVYAFHDDETGVDYQITQDVLVLDEDTNTIGHFVNLVWRDGRPVRSASKHASKPSGSGEAHLKKRRP
ncbi:hypothetical protein SPI_05248 [Niveomyces insectorum RCEF 264]|uniref:Uncharacterized protein n=1 Tax=Niveomyces insectorum RCEF 264 TaxID=1081102 RepID=A0A167U418_9HYPO|nr:hypothetical protein SPI_05248 [Niveomyces insectorum RCEF 264]